MVAIYGAASALIPETALTLEFVCTCLVLFVGVTLGFDKKRFKELGISMVCVVVAESMALAVFVSITVTGRTGYAGGSEPCKMLGSSIVARRQIVGRPLGFLGWALFCLRCLLLFLFEPIKGISIYKIPSKLQTLF